MDPIADPLITELHYALRAVLAHVPPVPGVHGAPVHDGSAGAASAALAELEAFAYERPAHEGGLELGLTAGVVVSEELGRAACGNPYRAAALMADLGAGLDAPDAAKPAPTAAGFEALPVGGAITVRSTGDDSDGWELTGSVTIDCADAGLLLVAVHVDGAPKLVSVPADAPGCTLHSELWPPVVRFESTPVTAHQVLGVLDDAPTSALTKARLRQAAYLLGIAEGALDAATRYVGTRRQFGTRLSEMQAVSLPLARAAVSLRAVRAAVRRGAWLVDSALPEAASAAVEALALASESADEVVRIAMQACGVRAMTPELSLHRYFRRAAAETRRYGDPAALWRLAGAARLERARHASAAAAQRQPQPAGQPVAS
jgi:alkylation response protein AidB-like acyl-CoA dehydrogenase